MRGFWIYLVNFSQGFKYASGKYSRAQNMTRLWICQGYTGKRICLNKPEYALIMSENAWICLNNAEYDWICWDIPEKQSTEYTRILNVSDTGLVELGSAVKNGPSGKHFGVFYPRYS